jgi:hypothetical protein
MKVLSVLIVALALSSCTRPGDHPISSNCSWIEDDNRTLNLSNISERRHLRNDAATAEDVAIRWADERYHLLPEYDSRREQCMESLFSGVASHHGVEVALVRQYSNERDVVADVAVILSFGLLYLGGVYYIVGRIRRRFSEDESANFWVMTIVLSVGSSLIGLLCGSLWSIAIETYLLNSHHLSYRMNRIPCRRYWLAFLLCGLVAFWSIAFLRSFKRASLSSDQSIRSA